MPSNELAALITTALIRAGCRHRDGRLNTLAAEKLTGVDNRTIARIAAAEVNPTFDTVERILDAAGWEVRFVRRRKSRRKAGA